ncbi:sporulation kinase A [bacterium BMS3Abin05]|nr:sporulation kinase A [bacterium BMS3Abin05]GBE28074.1 sporulation kinase A [bacterium BMS3Bbin03]
MKPKGAKKQFPFKLSLRTVFFFSFLCLALFPLLFVHLIQNETVGKYEKNLGEELPQFIREIRDSEAREYLNVATLNINHSFNDANRALQTVYTLYPFWEEIAKKLSRAPDRINHNATAICSLEITRLLCAVRSISKYSKAFAILDDRYKLLLKEPETFPLLDKIPYRKIFKKAAAENRQSINTIQWFDLSTFLPDTSGYLIAVEPFLVNGERHHAILLFDLKEALKKSIRPRDSQFHTFFILKPFSKTVIIYSHLRNDKHVWKQIPIALERSGKAKLFRNIMALSDNAGKIKRDSLIAYYQKLNLNAWYFGAVSSVKAYNLPIEAKLSAYELLKKKYVKEFRYFLLFLILLLLGLSVLMAKAFQKPLVKLIRAVHAMKRGDLKQKVPEGLIGEFSELAEAFNGMSDKLHHTLQQLSDSENRYRSLIENAGEAIFVFSPDGVILETNTVCSAVLGYSANALIHKNVGDLFPNFPFLEYTAKEKKVLSSPLELIYQSPGGKVLSLNICVTKVEVSDKILFQAIVHDQTLQKQFEQKIIEQNRLLNLINTMTQSIIKKTDLEEIYEESIHIFMEMLEAVGGQIYFYEPNSQTLVLKYAMGENKEFLNKVKVFHTDKKMINYILNLGEIYDLPDISQNKNISRQFDLKQLKELGIQSLIGIPLIAEDTLVGSINLWLKKRPELDEGLKSFLFSIGTQIGLIVQHSLLLNQERKRANQLALLSQGLKIWSETEDFQEVLQKSVEFIHRNLAYWHVAIFLFDEEKDILQLKAIAGGMHDLLQIGYEQSIGKGIISEVVKTEKTYYAPNTEIDPHYFKYGEHQSKSELAVPLNLRGKLVGVVNIEEMEYEAFDAVDITTIETFADQLSFYYEFMERIKSEQRRTKQMELVSHLGTLMNANLNSKDFIRESVKKVQEQFGYFLASVYLVSSEEDETLVKVADSGGTASKWPMGHKTRFGKGLLGTAAKTKKLVCVNDVSKDPRFIPAGTVPTGSELCMPILLKEELLGILNIETSETNAFQEFDIHVVHIIVSQMSQALFNSRLFARVKHEKEKLDQILSEMGEGVAMTNGMEEILYVNPVFSSLFSNAEVGKKRRDVFPFYSSVREHAQYSEFINGDVDSIYLEYSHEDKILLITVSHFLDFNYSEYFLFVVKDISDFKRYECERIKSERLNLAVEMAGSIAHEINQPLTGILGYLSLIKEDLSGDNPMYPDLEEIEKQAERISELVKKFQNIVKVETKNYIGESAIIDLDRSSHKN